MGDLLARAAITITIAIPFLLLLLSSSSRLVAAVRPSSSSLGAVRRRYDYNSIFGFGDSNTDTGNDGVVFSWYGMTTHTLYPPYGSTFFGRPTGRGCDGRLVVDFIAERLDLPLVPPYLAHGGGGGGSLRHGANFAVGVATARDASFFQPAIPMNVSLGVQLQWFESLVPSLCATPRECQELFGSSLFFVGEIGFNDYSLSSWLAGMSVKQLRSLVPGVISSISIAIERLIKLGATSLLVSGMAPAGCMPAILVLFAGADDDPASYDPKTGCLKEMNELSAHHNTLLQESLDRIRAGHPDVDLAYADFFSPVMAMVESPAKFGFEEDDALVCCCGGPGKYHFNLDIFCSDPGADTCEDPSARLFWDGFHLTEAANRYIADEWISTIISPARASTYY